MAETREREREREERKREERERENRRLEGKVGREEKNCEKRKRGKTKSFLQNPFIHF